MAGPFLAAGLVSPTGQPSMESFNGLSLYTGQQVAVDTQCQRRVGMAEPFGDRLDAGAVSQHQRGVAMAQGVESSLR